jgi:hypothetical protein
LELELEVFYEIDEFYKVDVITGKVFGATAVVC